MQENHKTWMLLVLGVCLVVGIFLYLGQTQDPLNGRAPDYVRALIRERTVDEEYVLRLKVHGQQHSDEYLSVQAEANGLIGYLETVVDRGPADDDKIARLLSQVEMLGGKFRATAEKQLGHDRGEVKSIHPVDAVERLLKLMDSQEKSRREAVKETLRRCMFRKWEDIAPKGE